MAFGPIQAKKKQTRFYLENNETIGGIAGNYVWGNAGIETPTPFCVDLCAANFAWANCCDFSGHSVV
jgi:hypothetical protein